MLGEPASNVGRGSPWRPTHAGDKLNLKHAERLQTNMEQAKKHGITSESIKGSIWHIFARKHARIKHGKHPNKGKAKQGVGCCSSRRPTLDAPAGASNTLNSLLDVNHIQKESNKLLSCMKTLYYACKTRGDGKLTVSSRKRSAPPSLPELQVCCGSKFGEVVWAARSTGEACNWL